MSTILETPPVELPLPADELLQLSRSDERFGSFDHQLAWDQRLKAIEEQPIDDLKLEWGPAVTQPASPGERAAASYSRPPSYSFPSSHRVTWPKRRAKGYLQTTEQYKQFDRRAEIPHRVRALGKAVTNAYFSTRAKLHDSVSAFQRRGEHLPPAPHYTKRLVGKIALFGTVMAVSAVGGAHFGHMNRANQKTPATVEASARPPVNPAARSRVIASAETASPHVISANLPTTTPQPTPATYTYKIERPGQTVWGVVNSSLPAAMPAAQKDVQTAHIVNALSQKYKSLRPAPLSAVHVHDVFELNAAELG